MKHQYINLLLVGIIVLLLLASSSDSSMYSSSYKALPTLTPLPTPTPTPPFPARFAIPKLGIDTAVEPVEGDETGTMQLPQETNKVGWYYGGYKPGEKGNAVIGGHLDLTTGAPAIFYNLKTLTVGDVIEVFDEYGIQRIFKVTHIQTYPYDEIPIESIFGKSNHSHLNLITCAGVYNQNTYNYSHRLIIYTDLWTSPFEK